MHNGDVLGDEGRKALNACVKVKIYGKLETRRYDWKTALQLLADCYAGQFPPGFAVANSLPRERTYDIVDIHDALLKIDKMKCFEKPPEGFWSDKLRDLINKRRADVEREFEEALANPDGRLKYSWLVARRRVRDCFAGYLPGDKSLTLINFSQMGYSITDIHDAVAFWDKERERVEAQRAAVENECVKAIERNIGEKKYTQKEADMRVRNCLPFASWVPVGMAENKMAGYDIFDIRKAVVQFDGKKLFQKYPEEGPGSDELKKLIDEHRNNLEDEYRKSTSFSEKGKQTVTIVFNFPYSWSEAEHRVRGCFAGTFPGDTEIFPNMKKDESDQTYDIFDIKQAVDHFDAKTVGDVCKYDDEEPIDVDRNQNVDEQRAGIQSEYDEATSGTEIDCGSGFIVHDHFIITNRHVIETYLDKPESHKIYITNEAIGELACKVIQYDAGKDLALLYCPDLNLKQSGICPLQLSSHSLLPGMSIFTFGYPISHTGETALFVSGNVSGSREMLAGHSMVILNCSLNSGNSGGPVMCWVKGQLRVVGVATQKHIKDILTLEERGTIEKMRESLQTRAITDEPNFSLHVGKHILDVRDPDFKNPGTCQIPMFLLTLKLYDALETHSQFNLSNALPGHLVVEFIKNSVSNFTGEHREELEEIVKLSEDRDISNKL